MKKDKSEMTLTSYEQLKMDKSIEEIVKVECFPDSFMEKFSVNREHGGDNDEYDAVDSLDDGYEEFSVLAASAGRGVAELLVDPVYQGWRRALMITGYMQNWRTKYCHRRHITPDENCSLCRLGEH